MTFSFRRLMLKSLFGLSLFLSVFYLTILILLKLKLVSPGPSELIYHPWFFLYSIKYSARLVLWFMTGTGIIIIIPITANLFMEYYFKKSSSPEIFFFRLFLLTLPLHSIRLVFILAFNKLLPQTTLVLLTRFDIFIKLFALFSIFTSGLFPLGVNYQKFKYIFIGYSLIALSVSIKFPIDITAVTNQLLFKTSEEISYALICIGIEILTFINYLMASYIKNTRNYIGIAFGILFSLIGYELLSFTSFPTLIPGTVLLIAGIYIYGRQIYSIYLWE